MSAMRILLISRSRSSLNCAYSTGPHHLLISMRGLDMVATRVRGCLLGRRGVSLAWP